MSIRYLQYILSIALVVFLPDFSRAQVQLTSPFLMKLDKQKIYDKFFGKKGIVSFAIDDQKDFINQNTEVDQVRLSSIGLQLQLDAKVQKSSWLENKVIAAGKMKGLKLSIDELNYQYDEKQNIAGNEVRIKFAIKCYDVSLELQEDLIFYLFSNLDLLNRKPQLKVQSLQIMNTVKEQQILLGRCEGPEGSEDKLSEIVKSYLSNPQKLSGLLTPFAQSILDTKEKELNRSYSQLTRVFKFKDLQVYQYLKAMDYCGEKYYCLHGMFDFRMSQTQASTNQHVAPTKQQYEKWYKDENFSGHMAKVYFSQELIEKLTTVGYSSAFMMYDTETNEHEALRDLMGSRFKQYHTWRDLRSFPEDTNLKIKNYNAVAPKLESFTNGPSGINIAFKANVLSRMLAPKEENYVNYAYLRSELEGLFQIKLNEENMSFVIHAENLSTSHVFDPNYLEKYKPETKVKHSNIRDAISDLFNYKQLSVITNTWRLGLDLDINMKNIESEDRDVFIFLD